MPVKAWSDLMSDAGEAGDYEPLPEGDYDLIVTESKVKTASSGKTMYETKCSVETGPFASKKIVWHNFVITPENPTALGWFFRNMKALGLGQEFFAQNPSDHQVADALKGRRFRGQVKIRTWQGQDRNEIRGFWPASSNGAPPPGVNPVTAPPHAAPPPAVAVTPPPPPPAPPAPPPVQQPVAPPPVAEAPPPPPPPPPLPAAPSEPEAEALPPVPGPVGVAAAEAGGGDQPPAPPF